MDEPRFQFLNPDVAKKRGVDTNGNPLPPKSPSHLDKRIAAEDPVRHVTWRERSRAHITSTLHHRAAAAHRIGVVVEAKCTRCRKGCGPFDSCVVAFFRKEVPGMPFLGACTSCVYTCNGAECSLRTNVQNVPEEVWDELLALNTYHPAFGKDDQPQRKTPAPSRIEKLKYRRTRIVSPQKRPTATRPIRFTPPPSPKRARTAPAGSPVAPAVTSSAAQPIAPVVPPAATSRVAPPATTSRVSPAATPRVAPAVAPVATPAATSRVAPPATTSRVAPPATTSRVSPAATSRVSPAATSRVSPAATSRVAPPAASRVAPPATTPRVAPVIAPVATPAATSRVAPPATTSRVSPAATSRVSPAATSRVSPAAASRVAPVVAPVAASRAAPPATTSRVAPAVASRVAPPFAPGSSVASPAAPSAASAVASPVIPAVATPISLSVAPSLASPVPSATALPIAPSAAPAVASSTSPAAPAVGSSVAPVTRIKYPIYGRRHIPLQKRLTRFMRPIGSKKRIRSIRPLSKEGTRAASVGPSLASTVGLSVATVAAPDIPPSVSPAVAPAVVPTVTSPVVSPAASPAASVVSSVSSSSASSDDAQPARMLARRTPKRLKPNSTYYDSPLDDRDVYMAALYDNNFAPALAAYKDMPVIIERAISDQEQLRKMLEVRGLIPPSDS